MKKIILSIIATIMLCGCNKGEILDLSKIDFGKDSKEYKLSSLSPSRTNEQNGHYEVVYDPPLADPSVENHNSNVSLVIKDDGEKVTNYSFDDDKSNSHINYAGLPLDASYGTKIVDYNGKISFISTSINRERTLDLISFLEKSIGHPTEIITNETMEATLKPDRINQLIEIFPDDTKRMKNDWGNDIISYPEILIWNENDKIYQLTLNPVGEDITNYLVVISKKAFKDKVIFGFHVPEKSHIFDKYLK